MSENLRTGLNSHQNVFNSILNQISGNTEYEVPFLHLLQHLLSIEYKCNELPVIIWDSAEALVQRATTTIKSKEDAEKLLKLIEKRKASLEVSPNVANSMTLNNPIPPPPPPLPSISLTLTPPPPPPPPPVPNGSAMNGGLSDNQLLFPNSVQPVLRNKNSMNESNGSPVLTRKLPQQEIPKPKNRMKSINWCKLSPEKVVSTIKPNLWTLVATQHESDHNSNVDFNELEDLFRQPSNSSAPNSCPGSPRMQRRPVSSEIVGSPFNSLERKVIKRQSGEYQLPNELQLLDGKKSLNVNIFLKQYKETVEELVNKIANGEHKEIGTERLKNLLKILPEPNEIELLKSNEEESHRFPIAEKFLLNVIKIPNYKLKIEAMLLKEEFESNVTYLEPSIVSVKRAAKEIRESKSLHELLYLILVSGNFLNSGGYAGDAAGFKMMSLLKLPEIRANKPGVNLIHYVAMQAEKKGLNNFAQELPSLEEASKVSIENLRIEVNCLSNKIEKLKQQIEKQKEDSVHKELSIFLNSSEKEVKKLSVDIEKQLNEIRIEMAEFLCEDVERFKLEECFRILSSFCLRFKLAIDENERRRDNEMKLEARKSNSQLKKWTQSTESDNFLNTENSLTPTNSSNCLTNSLNSSLNFDSKLRRRSRRGSQDDDLHNGLLEFLRTANDLGSSGDIPILGGSFRRIGSGRRSRSSNTILDSDFFNRDRNTNDLRTAQTIDEMETNDNKRVKVNSDLHTKSTTNLSEGESDEDSNKRKAFDRFSPLRRTLGYKPSQSESRFAKRFIKPENNEISIKSDRNNNNIIESQNSEQIVPKNEEQKEMISSPIQLRQYWASKQNPSNDMTSAITRPTTLHLSSNHHNSQQPTAIITPTKVIRNVENGNNELLSPVLALETDRLNRIGCLPRRTSLSSPSNATAAAIVTPIQMNEKMMEKEIIPIPPPKSKLPVRKAALTPLPLQRKNGENKTGIPLPSRTSTRNTNGMSNSRPHHPIPNARTYRSPSTVSRTNLTSDKGSVASMKRSAQILSANRSFMKQTSSSAAKTRNHSRY